MGASGAGSDPNSQQTSQDVSDGATIAGGTASGAAMGSAAGPYGAAIGAVIGAGISIYGVLSSSGDQAAIDAEKQAQATNEANQVALREQQNDAIRNQATYQNKLNVSSEQAGSGHETAGIGSQLEVQRQSNLQTQIDDQAAAFQASQLQAGGAMQGQAGAETQTAGYVGAAGAGATLIGKLGAPTQGVSNYSGIQSLPSPGSPYNLGVNTNVGSP